MYKLWIIFILNMFIFIDIVLFLDFRKHSLSLSLLTKQRFVAFIHTCCWLTRSYTFPLCWITIRAAAIVKFSRHVYVFITGSILVRRHLFCNVFSCVDVICKTMLFMKLGALYYDCIKTDNWLVFFCIHM